MSLPATSAGQTCLITGASSGIGAEITRQLAARGRNVALVARRVERLETLADELVTAYGVRVDCLPTDLASEAERSRLPARLEALGLTVGVLVNNAGLSTSGPVAQADRDAELAMVRTDVEAVIDLCTLFVPGMVGRAAGALLNIASSAAYQPTPGQAGYGASKAFVLSYSWSLRAELRGTGVSVTTVCPGPVETGFFDVAGISHDERSQGLPKLFWVPAPEVARLAVEGLERGKALVTPGVANRVAAVAGRMAPWGVVSSVVASQHPALKR